MAKLYETDDGACPGRMPPPCPPWSSTAPHSGWCWTPPGTAPGWWCPPSQPPLNLGTGWCLPPCLPASCLWPLETGDTQRWGQPFIDIVSTTAQAVAEKGVSYWPLVHNRQHPSKNLKDDYPKPNLMLEMLNSDWAFTPFSVLVHPNLLSLIHLLASIIIDPVYMVVLKC